MQVFKIYLTSCSNLILVYIILIFLDFYDIMHISLILERSSIMEFKDVLPQTLRITSESFQKYPADSTGSHSMIVEQENQYFLIVVSKQNVATLLFVYSPKLSKQDKNPLVMGEEDYPFVPNCKDSLQCGGTVLFQTSKERG